MIFDPTLYGPPTIFQHARRLLKDQVDLLARDYEALAAPLLRALERHPDARETRQRLADLDRDFRRQRDALAEPFVGILAIEPRVIVVRQDGELHMPTEERAPMM